MLYELQSLCATQSATAHIGGGYVAKTFHDPRDAFEHLGRLLEKDSKQIVAIFLDEDSGFWVIEAFSRATWSWLRRLPRDSIDTAREIPADGSFDKHVAAAAMEWLARHGIKTVDTVKV